MNIYWRLVLSTLTGVLVWFSFPTVLFGWHVWPLGWLGWLALVPLFVALSNEQVKLVRKPRFLSFMKRVSVNLVTFLAEICYDSIH